MTAYSKTITEKISVLQGVSNENVPIQTIENALDYFNIGGDIYGESEIGVAHSFTGNGRYLHSATFFIDKITSAAYNVYARLYTHTGTFGVSSEPDDFIDSSYPISAALISSTPDYYQFKFTPFDNFLEEGVKYCIVLYYGYSDGFISPYCTDANIEGNSAVLIRGTLEWVPITYKSLGFSINTLSDPLNKETTKVITNQFSINEKIKKDISHIIKETLNLVDNTIETIRLYFLSIVDSMSISDSIIKSLQKAISDTIGIVENIITNVKKELYGVIAKISQIKFNGSKKNNTFYGNKSGEITNASVNNNISFSKKISRYFTGKIDKL